MYVLRLCFAEWAPEAASELLATSLHPNMPLETLRQVHQAAGKAPACLTFSGCLSMSSPDLSCCHAAACWCVGQGSLLSMK